MAALRVAVCEAQVPFVEGGAESHVRQRTSPAASSAFTACRTRRATASAASSSSGSAQRGALRLRSVPTDGRSGASGRRREGRHDGRPGGP